MKMKTEKELMDKAIVYHKLRTMPILFSSFSVPPLLSSSFVASLPFPSFPSFLFAPQQL